MTSPIRTSSLREHPLLLWSAALGLLATTGCSQILGLEDFTDEPGAGGNGGGGAGGMSSSTSSSTSSSANGGAGGSGGAKECGNNMLDGTEECDEGVNNGPGQACNGDCRLNICGDGDPGPNEKCDEGAENGLGLLKCAPDCSRVIVKRQIIVSTFQPTGIFGGPNPVAFADSQCPANHKALFAFGDLRRATTVGNKVVNPVDWPLAPFTYYYNAQSNPVWLTDAVALLGVRNSTFVGLENPVRPNVTTNSLTGLAADWTTLGSNNCNGWTSIQSSPDRSQGWSFASDISFIVDAGLGPCNLEYVFYCVEQ